MMVWREQGSELYDPFYYTVDPFMVHLNNLINGCKEETQEMGVRGGKTSSLSPITLYHHHLDE